MKKITILTALLLCASASLFSCGNSSEGKLIIGLECGYAPFNWTENVSNEYTLPIANQANSFADGYDIQIAKYLSLDLGMEVVIMQTAWESLVTDLQNGYINAIIAGMTDTAERRLSIDFTNEYYRSELVLVTSKTIADNYDTSLTANQFRDLITGQIVVSQNNTVTDDVINIFVSEYGAQHAPSLSSFALAAQDVVGGNAFAMTAELPVAQSIVAANPTLGIVHIDQNILGDAQSELGVSIGIKKGDTELCDKINASLAKLSSDKRVELMQGAIARSTNA